MYNKEGYIKVKQLVTKQLRGVNYRHLNAVEVYGKLVYLDASELRALQIVVKEAFENNVTEGKELQENILVYSGAHKRKSETAMHICSDGYLDGELEPGLYDVEQLLTRKLLD